VIIKRRLDYEALPAGDKTISVDVMARSRDLQRSAVATIRINVQDLNDNEPKFDQMVRISFEASCKKWML